jgi:hypothetical protein
MKTQHTIQHLCNITEYRYCETIFRMGMEYLYYETCGDEFYVSEISKTKEFWQWWNKIVDDRNQLFVREFSLPSISSQELYFAWESLLNVKSLRIYPPAEIWSAGYENLVKTVSKVKL